jgi:hypothetical protein
MKEKSSKKGVRISLENFGRFNNLEIYPLYAVKNVIGNI